MLNRELITPWGIKWELERSTLNQHRIGFIKNLLQVLQGINGTVVEVGCGSGLIGSYAAKNMQGCSRMVEIDLEKIALERTRQFFSEQGTKADLILGNAFSLPLASESVEAIWSEGLLEHFPDRWREILREKVRVTKPGGLVITAVPNTLNLPRTLIVLCQGEKFRYFPAYPFMPGSLGSLQRQYEKFGVQIEKTAGWAPTYPAEHLYEWEEETQTRRYPLYCRLSHVLGRLSKPVFEVLDQITHAGISRWFGFEFMLVGRKLA